MTSKHQIRSITSIKIVTLVCILVLQAFPVSFKSIDSAYAFSKRHYAEKEYSKAHSTLRKAMGNAPDFASVVHENDRKKFIPILNDYAFFLFKDFEFQSGKWCAHPEKASATDFQTFRSQTLDEAQEALEFVVNQDSTRVVALLNLADVYLNQDEPEKAEIWYAKYVKQMKLLKKESKIVSRARNQRLRKRAFDCK